MRKFLLTFIFLIAFITNSFCQDCYKTTKTLNVRSGAGINYTVLLTLNQGDEVEVIDKTNSTWYQVKSSSVTGFVASQYLTSCMTENKSSITSRFIETYKIPLLISIALVTLAIILIIRDNKRRAINEQHYYENSDTNSYSQRPIVTRPTKNVGLAMFLAIIFPYFGVLYATVAGFFWLFFSYIAMWGLLLYFGLKTLNDGILFIGLVLSIIHFIISIIWAGIAANNYNKKIIYNSNY